MKFLSKALALLLGAGLLGYVAIYLFYHNSEDRVLSPYQQQWLIDEISNTTPLPANIFTTLEKHYPDLYEENTWSFKIKKLLDLDASTCQCNEIYLPFIPDTTTHRLEKLPWVPFNRRDPIMKIFLEKHFSQKECLNYYLTISDFGRNLRGITMAANIYFGKDLSELNEEDIIGLYIIPKAPTGYNPKSNPERYQQVVQRILARKQNH